MSRQAISAVIARSDLASGERLVALSLASFADRREPGLAWRAGGRGAGRSRRSRASREARESGAARLVWRYR